VLKSAASIQKAMSFGEHARPHADREPRVLHAQTALRLPGGLGEYAFAAMWVAGLVLIRGALEPVLGGMSPFLIFVLPTAVMAMRMAPGAAAFAALLSTLGAVGLFVAPADRLWWSHPAEQMRLAMFLGVNGVIVALATLRARPQRALQEERLRVVRITMRTVEDIVNNSLNQLYLLRLEADGRVAPETLQHFDETIQDMAAKVTNIGRLTTFAEKQMVLGMALDDNPTRRM
jgi:K+-sensing histidine kinase KdpD